MYEIKIFTLYPETFPSYLAGGIYEKAMGKGLWNLKTVNIRDYAEDKQVPNVLLSGDHAKIKGWRLTQSEAITRRQRPDLWEKYKKEKKQ